MSYDMIDRFLRNNLGDDDYAEYSAALDAICAQPVVSEPSSGERAESESAAFEKWVENSNRYHSHKIKGPIGGYARDMMACAQDGWMARAALLSSDAKPASEQEEYITGIDGPPLKPASEPVAVPQGWKPSEEQFQSWLERYFVHPTDRDAFFDAASLYLTAAPSPAPVGIKKENQ